MTDQGDAVVLVEQRGGVMIVRLNRPARRNAIDQALADRLRDVIAEAEGDSRVRAGVLVSSTPGMFCSGGDLKAMAAGETPRVDDVFSSLADSERAVPWIAAVDGAVLGGGLELALACDMIVAAEAAAFGLPEPRRGILAAGGGVFRLPRRIPRAVALEMILTGRTIGAARALELGLVNRVTSPGQLLDAALDLAEAIAQCAPRSVAESLRIARATDETPEEALWVQARAALARLRATDDHGEGLAAFSEKRAPVWGPSGG